MEKVFWFEVFGFVDNEEINGTETIETFDTLKEAKKYLEKHKGISLFIDKWQMNKDGSGEAEKIG
jgi:hypothetical protein